MKKTNTKDLLKQAMSSNNIERVEELCKDESLDLTLLIECFDFSIEIKNLEMAKIIVETKGVDLYILGECQKKLCPRSERSDQAFRLILEDQQNFLKKGRCLFDLIKSKEPFEQIKETIVLNDSDTLSKRDGNGKTVLHYAVLHHNAPNMQQGSHSILGLLIGKVDSSIRDNNWNTAFDKASKDSRLLSPKGLVKKLKADTNRMIHANTHALAIAISNENNEQIQSLLERRCADPSHDVVLHAGSSASPLKEAIKARNPLLFSELLRYNDNLLSDERKDQTKLEYSFCICLAALHNQFEMCKQLLKYELDISSKHSGIFMAFYLAIKNSNLDLCKEIFTYAAARKVEKELISMNGFISFYESIKDNNLPMCEYLLSYSEVRVELFKRHGAAALQVAVEQQNMQLCELLLSYPEVRMELFDRYGFAALQMVVEQQNMELCEVLLRKFQSEIIIRAICGVNILHCAVNKNNIDLSELILLYCPELINKANKDEDTPLHCATKSNLSNMVKFLIRHGADRNILDARKNDACFYWDDAGAVPFLMAKHDPKLHEKKLLLEAEERVYSTREKVLKILQPQGSEEGFFDVHELSKETCRLKREACEWITRKKQHSEKIHQLAVDLTEVEESINIIMDQKEQKMSQKTKGKKDGILKNETLQELVKRKKKLEGEMRRSGRDKLAPSDEVLSLQKQYNAFMDTSDLFLCLNLMFHGMVESNDKNMAQATSILRKTLEIGFSSELGWSESNGYVESILELVITGSSLALTASLGRPVDLSNDSFFSHLAVIMNNQSGLQPRYAIADKIDYIFFKQCGNATLWNEMSDIISIQKDRPRTRVEQLMFQLNKQLHDKLSFKLASSPSRKNVKAKNEAAEGVGLPRKPEVAEGAGLPRKTEVAEGDGLPENGGAAVGFGLLEDGEAAEGFGLLEDGEAAEGFGLLEDGEAAEGFGLLENGEAAVGFGLLEDGEAAEGVGLPKENEAKEDPSVLLVEPPQPNSSDIVMLPDLDLCKKLTCKKGDLVEEEKNSAPKGSPQHNVRAGSKNTSPQSSPPPEQGIDMLLHMIYELPVDVCKVFFESRYMSSSEIGNVFSSYSCIVATSILLYKDLFFGEKHVNEEDPILIAKFELCLKHGGAYFKNDSTLNIFRSIISTDLPSKNIKITNGNQQEAISKLLMLAKGLKESVAQEQGLFQDYKIYFSASLYVLVKAYSDFFNAQKENYMLRNEPMPPDLLTSGMGDLVAECNEHIGHNTDYKNGFSILGDQQETFLINIETCITALARLGRLNPKLICSAKINLDLWRQCQLKKHADSTELTEPNESGRAQEQEDQKARYSSYNPTLPKHQREGAATGSNLSQDTPLPSFFKPLAPRVDIGESIVNELCKVKQENGLDILPFILEELPTYQVNHCSLSLGVITATMFRTPFSFSISVDHHREKLIITQHQDGDIYQSHISTIPIGKIKDLFSIEDSQKSIFMSTIIVAANTGIIDKDVLFSDVRGAINRNSFIRRALSGD